MKFFWKKNRSLKNTLFLSWGIIAAAGFLTTATACSIFYYFERQARSQSTEEVLRTKFERVRGPLYRQLAGGANLDDPIIHDLINELKDKLELTDIFIKAEHSCETEINKDCLPNYNKRIWYVSDLGFENLFLILAKDKPLLDWTPVLLVFGGISITLFFGILFQNLLLKRSILDPALMLVELVKSDLVPKDVSRWPLEFQTFSEKLKHMLAERDQAIKKAAMQESAAIKDSEYASFAHSLLHAVKRPLLSCIATIRNNPDISEEVKNSVVEILDRPHTWIQRALNDYIRGKDLNAGLKFDLGSTQISTIGATTQIICKDYISFAENTGIDFSFHSPISLRFRFCQLRSQDLYRCLQEVISNGLEAIEQSPQKQLNVKCSFFVEDDKECCEISVKDTGLTFQQEALRALKENRSFTSKAKGNGFGLVDIKRTLERIGGRLSVLPFDSYKVVKLTIPLVPTPEWIYDIHALTQPVFILDDDPSILRKVRNTLVFADPQSILLFKNEQDLLKAARDNLDSFLLVDYDYQGSRNGLQLIEQEHLKDRAAILSGLVPGDSHLIRTAIEKTIRVYPKESLLNFELKNINRCSS